MKDCSAIPFNTGWKFLLGDPKNAQRKNYPDRTWKDVDLPHDWVISQPFNRGEAGSWTPQNMQGFFVWEGIAWYRKEFTLPNLDEKEVYIYFGGAYRNSAVYINGKAAGGRAYGYSSFELNISGFVKKGRNTIAVRLDNGCEAPDRWYSGSGLYRDVYLKITPTAHIKTWGVYAQPSLTGSVKVLTTLVDRNKAAAGTLNIQIKDMDGSIVAENSAPFNFNEEPRPKGTGYLRSPVELHSGFNTLNERPEGRGIKPLSTNKKNEIMVEQHLRIKNPKLWSAETPNLYLMAVCLSEGETQVNSKNLKGSVKSMTEVSFGFRKIDIVNRKGMIVNGQSVKLKGVCLHHDCGITGSAYYDAVWRRRLITLKDIGCNAIRTSHNPPSEEFLDLCDELGFYVIDECFDKWKSGYYAAHFDQDAQQDLESMILRDRNHPSVFMWSIGNEVENQGSPSMLEIQKKLAAIARSLDDRPVTCALSP
ncbi:MAG: hypothetical protein FWC24_06985, partial [Treponema sp.]|nr:hypothetical protein [Treponema sp.]